MIRKSPLAPPSVRKERTMRGSHATQHVVGWLSATLIGTVAVGLEARAQQAGPFEPPSARVQAPAPSQDNYAPNLGISYQLVPYGGAFGARLTRNPASGSPAAQLQLEPGDMITTLDNQPIYGPNDVLNHSAYTTVVFVNVRTGRPQSGAVFIPGSGPTRPPYPPGPPSTPYVLGVVTVPVTLNDGGAGAYSSRRPGSYYNPNPGGNVPIGALRITGVSPGGAAQRAGLEVGDTIVSINQTPTPDAQTMRWAIANSGGVLRMTVKNGRPPYDYVTPTVYLRPSGPIYYGAPAAATP
jgi:S1-C subfamily serine protease